MKIRCLFRSHECNGDFCKATENLEKCAFTNNGERRTPSQRAKSFCSKAIICQQRLKKVNREDYYLLISSQVTEMLRIEDEKIDRTIKKKKLKCKISFSSSKK